MGIRDANSGNVCRGVRAVMSRGSEETEIRRGQEGYGKTSHCLVRRNLGLGILKSILIWGSGSNTFYVLARAPIKTLPLGSDSAHLRLEPL